MNSAAEVTWDDVRRFQPRQKRRARFALLSFGIAGGLATSTILAWSFLFQVEGSKPHSEIAPRPIVESQKRIRSLSECERLERLERLHGVRFSKQTDVYCSLSSFKR